MGPRPALAGSETVLVRTLLVPDIMLRVCGCGAALQAPCLKTEVSPPILHTHTLEGAGARARARDTALALALALALD